MKKAFTMAEVLITLAIIGIVAALTIPALVSKYKRKVVAVRLQHFAATYRQAKRLVDVNAGGRENLTLEATESVQRGMEFYEKYLQPVLKTESLEQGECGAMASLADGSGFYIYGRAPYGESNGDNGRIPPYIVFCPYFKDCKAISNAGCRQGCEVLTDGRRSFCFYSGAGTTPDNLIENASREVILDRCVRMPGFCSHLIEFDGWEIKDDYPYKI